ncbi:MAG: ABC transporter substrate-binding protein, partial [Acidimicrobiia bacterium]
MDRIYCDITWPWGGLIGRKWGPHMSRVSCRRRRRSRRGSMVVVGIVVAALLVACGDDGDESVQEPSESAGVVDGEDESPASEGESDEFDEDGVLRAMVTQVPITLDPAQTFNASPWPYIFEIYDRLIARDVDNKLVPMLATKWEFSADGLALSLTLRDDVRFNDGTPLTSADVKATIERSKTLSGSAWVRVLDPVVAVETPDEHEVVLRLSRPAGSLPAVLSTPAGAVVNAAVIAAGADLANDPPAGAGSGPRVVESFVVNSRVDFVRADDDYWEPDANRLARVSIIRVADPVAQLNAFRAGEADLVAVKQETSKQAKALAEGSDEVLFKERSGSQHNVVYFNSRREPLDRVEVRQALNLGIDRGAIEDYLDG